MRTLELKKKRRVKRKLRIRGRISGTADRPRLSVYKSNRYLYVQVIDDVAGNTLASVTTAHGELAGLKNTVVDAEKVGMALGEKLKAHNITRVVFDRNGNLYHGVIKAIADGTRKAGIQL